MRFVPKWRKATWALFIFSVLMLIWVVSGIASSGGHATNCGSLDQSSCDAARNIGAGIGVTLLFVIWFIGFIILSLVWLMSRPRHRACPRCGNDVKKNVMLCRKCGYDFASAYGGNQSAGSGTATSHLPSPSTTPAMAAPPGAPVSPDGKYWWDGYRWQPSPASP